MAAHGSRAVLSSWCCFCRGGGKLLCCCVGGISSFLLLQQVSFFSTRMFWLLPSTLAMDMLLERTASGKRRLKSYNRGGANIARSTKRWSRLTEHTGNPAVLLVLLRYQPVDLGKRCFFISVPFVLEMKRPRSSVCLQAKQEPVTQKATPPFSTESHQNPMVRE